ncbi:hypothetical protein [Pseudolysinimonas kribbensis]
MTSRSDVVPLPPQHETDADDTADDEVVTGEAVALDLRPAGFALRAGVPPSTCSSTSPPRTF